MILTVTIPTYNRPESLTRVVSKLLAQLNDLAGLLIIDNCSDQPMAEYLKLALPDADFSRIRIVRNRINIGMDGNICRCFELCETPWIWTLSDDDLIEDDAVQTVLEQIDAYKENVKIIGFNFFSNCCEVYDVSRSGDVQINSIPELIDKLDVFGNWMFMSTGVYNTAAYLQYFRFTFWGSYSMVAFVVPVMLALRDQMTFVLSDKYIVTNTPLADQSQKWSDFQISLSLTSLLEARVGFKKDEYQAFGKKLFRQFVSFPEALCSIVRSVNYNYDLIDNYHYYIYDQIYSRTIDFRPSKLRQQRNYYLCKMLLKNKWLLKLSVNMVPRLKARIDRTLTFYLFTR
jgi:glycosyltransferase involved in cell wall biosynthesis